MITLTRKECRKIEFLLEQLFSSNIFTTKPTVDYLKDIRFITSVINHGGRQYIIAQHVFKLYTELTNILIMKDEFSAYFTRNEVFQQVAKSHKHYLFNENTIDQTALLNHILTSLEDMKQWYKFLIPVDGIELTDADQFTLGNVLLCRSDISLLDEIQFQSAEEKEQTHQQVKSKYWFICVSYGGPEYARAITEDSVKIAAGILAIYCTALFKHAFLQAKISVKLTAYDGRSTAISLRWTKGGKDLSTSRCWGNHQPIKLNSAVLTELTTNLFASEFSQLTLPAQNSELRQAIRAAIFWFFDAHQDSNITMKFIKLWSCSECFFSKRKVDLSDHNAAGITAILTYGSFGIISPPEYSATRSKAKQLYDLRSRAVHNADLNQITDSDVETLSFWISWVLISLFALTEQGYTTIDEAMKQIDRLDSLESERSVTRNHSDLENT